MVMQEETRQQSASKLAPSVSENTAFVSRTTMFTQRKSFSLLQTQRAQH